MAAPTFEPHDQPTFSDFRREVTERRSAGKVHVELRCFLAPAGASATFVATAFVKSLALKSPDLWTELDAREALEVATRALQVDLAYKVPVMTIEGAKGLARRFLEYFGGEATFVTNGTLAMTNGDGSWAPLTDATFDTGIVGVAPGRVGLLWVEDED